MPVFYIEVACLNIIMIFRKRYKVFCKVLAYPPQDCVKTLECFLFCCGPYTGLRKIILVFHISQLTLYTSIHIAIPVILSSTFSLKSRIPFLTARSYLYISAQITVYDSDSPPWSRRLTRT